MVAGCSDDGGEKKPDVKADAVADADDVADADPGDAADSADGGAVDPAPVAKVVGAEGGEVAHSSGAKLMVPPGAVPAGVEITVEAAPAPAAVAAIGEAVGAALVLGPEGQTFLAPVEIALPVAAEALVGVDPAKELQIVLAPSSGGAFVALETTWDAATKQLLAKTSHFSIAVPVKLKAPPLTVTLPTLPQPEVGKAYGPYAFAASGGAAPYTWSLAGGSLPPGLLLSPAGELSGTPEQAGKFAPTVRVRDALSQALDKALALEIDGPPNAKPELTGLEPGAVVAGSGETTLSVKGSGFAYGALVLLAGKGVPTVRIDASTLEVTVKAALLAQPGTLAVAVVNPPPGGGTSAELALQIAEKGGDIDADAGGDADADDGDAGDAADGDDATDGGDSDGNDVETDTGPPCTPTVPATEVCDGVDNDCDGKTDEDPCSDGKICTVGDACKGEGAAAACVGGPAVDCEDGNPCTTDSCDPKKGCIHAPSKGGCSDGLPCTVGDFCQDSSCHSGPGKVCADGEPCTLDSCDIATGECKNDAITGCGDPCASVKDCVDDNNPCTSAACKLGHCTLLPASGGCDDGNACSSGDTCIGGACLGGTTGCDDGDACTLDVCDGKSGCVHTAKDGGPCSDGDACTVLDVCAKGSCKAGVALNCDDGAACVSAGCDAKTGCTTSPAPGSCDDGDPCTTSDACADGTCAGAPTACDDGDACTADSCGAQGVCKHAAIDGCGASCKVDGDCQGGAACVSLQCSAGACAPVLQQGACDDGDGCTQGDSCKGGVCLPGAASPCDDGDPCTTDACGKDGEGKSGCIATPLADAAKGPCSDGKSCTADDVCVGGVCKGKAFGEAASNFCDDGNPCTVDTCKEGVGCEHLPAEGACDDGNACSVGESCKGGVCKDGVAKDCSDGKPCTVDACVIATGACTSTPLPGCGDPCNDASDCKGGAQWCQPPKCNDGVCGLAGGTAPCDDGDPCTKDDTCSGGLCAGKATACDDGNPCTVDACGAGGACSSTPLVGACSDGDACTTADVCVNGICKAGGVLGCDDDNPCTDDSCDPKSGCLHPDSKTPCSDGDPCTVGDACKDAACKPTGPKVCDDGDACTTDSCNAKDGSCGSKPIIGCGENCLTPKDCKDDGDVCTDWACTGGKCAVTFTTAACDDTSACTSGDTCTKGVCKGKSFDTPGNTFCDDGNPCSDDTCDPSQGCKHAANTKPCTDGAICTAGDVCKDMACVPGKQSSCDDGNACTFDLCDTKTGCQHQQQGMACSDGDACTVGDGCVQGSCVAGKLIDCADGNPCTFDACQAGTGACAHTPAPGCGVPCADSKGCVDTGDPCANLGCVDGTCQVTETGAGCDDGNACTSNDGCLGGQCRGKGGNCDDGNACTADACNPKVGCAHGNATGLCEDGNLCTVQDACTDGACKAGPSQQCADGNPCTQDACDPKIGCLFAAANGSCSDGDGCTTGDACKGGVCLPSGVTSCDDGDACTADSCLSAKGTCVHTKVEGCGAPCQTAQDCKDDGNPCTATVCSAGACGLAATASPCDDGDACTSGDACEGGACLGLKVLCNDDNPCSTDACDPKTGCSHSAASGPCQIGSACVAKAACVQGSCQALTLVACDDGNACTHDRCDPVAGCVSTPSTAPCDDGSACTSLDACDDGVCKGGVRKPCNDGLPCTLDRCDDGKGGCVFEPIAGCGAPCQATKDCKDTGSPCTVAHCANNTCVAVYLDVPCDDGDPCSTVDTCQAGVCTGTVATCDDGNSCTADACDAKNGCTVTLLQGACSDGSACTASDTCQGGACKGGSLLDCNDGNPCTADTCDAKLGCKSTPSKAACDDGDPCTEGDACSNGACQHGKVVSCDDGKPCTLDACDPTTGACDATLVAGCGAPCGTDGDCADPAGVCVGLACTAGACELALVATACDDANACTTGDSCKAGACRGTAISCDDGDTCTADACDPSKGCSHKALADAPALPCDDGDACTLGDVCAKGSCSAGKALGCDDGNPCTADSCAKASGCVSLPQKVTCDDGNACTVEDSCLLGFCLGKDAKDCDDGNPCTFDLCSTASGCFHSAKAGACDDGDACTEADACDKGVCAKGKARVCDDGSVCTTDGCDPKTGCTTTAKPGPCDDGSACTESDLCLFGKCLGGKAKSCDDGQTCTADSCDAKLGCLATAVTGTCDDGDDCTSGESCANGTCSGGKPIDCDDGHPCTADSCDKAAGCVHKLADQPCSDGDPCTGPDVCVAGKCSSGPPIACDDTNPCTDESCQKGKGCVVLPNTVTCTDGDACTKGDACAKGVCVPGSKLVCDDSNVCTDDSCDKAKGCVYLPNTASCTDDSACTEGDLCDKGSCKVGPMLECDDGKVCTDDSCDPKKGCVHVATTKPCDDGDACTESDVCQGGACKSGAAKVCDDGKVCTFDSCDSGVGCVFTQGLLPCDDGDACTVADVCEGGSCKPGKAKVCDDGEGCTKDSCDKAKGCLFVAEDKPCDDGDACTVGDACVGGSCKAGSAKNCDDGNPCTTDACDKAKGCSNLVNTDACSDGDACTSPDVCADGVCLAGKAKLCDDGNSCTDDSCDPKTGCVFAANVAACDDGTVCTEGDACKDKVCGTKAVTCDDGNDCTDDSCDKVKGCQYVPNQKTGCSDGNACTNNDGCKAGACVGTAISCSDGKACTLDTCDPKSGCAFVASGKLCDDGDPCTVDTCDTAAGCKHAPAADGAACVPTSDACPVSATCQAGACVAAAAPKASWKTQLSGEVRVVAPMGDGWVVGGASAYTCGGEGTLRRLDASGAVLWQQPLYTSVSAVAVTKSGDIVALPESPGSDEHYIALFAADGTKKWQTRLPTGLTNWSSVAVAQTSYGYVVLLRFAEGKLFRFAGDGSFLGSTNLPTTPAGYDYFSPRGLTVDNGSLVITGSVAGGPGQANCLRVLDESGTLIKQQVFSKGQTGGGGQGCSTAAMRVGSHYLVYSDDGGLTKLQVSDLAIASYTMSDAIPNWGGTNAVAIRGDNELYLTGDIKVNNQWVTGLAKADLAGKLAWAVPLDGSSGRAVVVVGDRIVVGSSASTSQSCKSTLTQVQSCTSTLCAGVTCQDDGIACTVARCDAAKGCVHDATNALCEDGNPCTTLVCDAAKGCVVVDSAATACDDGNPCTTELCDPAKGCSHANTTDPCDDGDACTLGDACKDAQCKGKALQVALACADGNPCTADQCDSSKGCVNPPLANGTPCASVADACAVNATCNAGACLSAVSNPTWQLTLTGVDAKMLSPAGSATLVASRRPYGDNTSPGKVIKVDRNGVVVWTYAAPSPDVWSARATPAGDVVYATAGGFGLIDGKGALKWARSVPEFNGGGISGLDAHGLPDGTYVAFSSNGALHRADKDGNKIATTYLQPTTGTGVFATELGVDVDQIVVAGRQLPGSSWNSWYAGVKQDGTIFKTYEHDGPDASFQDVVRAGSNRWVLLAQKAGVFRLASVQVSGLGMEAYSTMDVSGIQFGGFQGLASKDATSVFAGGEAKVNNVWKGYLTIHDISGARAASKVLETGSIRALSSHDGAVHVAAYSLQVPTNALLRRMAFDLSGSESEPSCKVTSKCTGLAKECDDGVACTIDACAATTGCSHQAQDGLCDDGQVCTANVCDAQKGCLFTTSIVCDDGNPCTDDTCDAIKGCVTKANAASCDDGNACTVGDGCAGGSCLAGAAKNCEDGLACTSHGCDKTAGCKQTANASKCDDGKPCTSNACDLSKGCVFAPDLAKCDDGNVCTDDSCDDVKGCAHAANAVTCDDANACTVADVCKAGTCKGNAFDATSNNFCNDLNECTAESCNPATGCVISNVSAGTACSPSTSCSLSATCGGGTCNDGPPKYWVNHLADNIGGFFGSHNGISLPNDNAGPVYVYSSDNNSWIAHFARVSLLGQVVFDATATGRNWYGVRCSPWNNQTCVTLGRNTANDQAVAEDRSFADGSKKAEFVRSLTSGMSTFTDAGFLNGGPTTYSGYGCPGAASTCDAFVVTSNQNQTLLAFAGGQEDVATSVHIDTKNGSWAVGYTRSKGAGGEDAWFASIGNPENTSNGTVTDVTTYGTAGDERFYNVLPFGGAVWAFGTQPVNGQVTPMAVRIAGGAQVVKTYPSLWGSGELGAVAYGSNVVLGGVRGDIAKLDANLDIVWQAGFAKSPINVAYHSVAINGSAIVMGGGGFNGQTGKTSLVVGRVSLDGLTNCTDSNPCANLAANGCDDGAACTLDACDVKKGCLHTPVDALCTDGNPCTADTCGSGGCTYGPAQGVPCNDGNPCTVDVCDAGAKKCVYSFDPEKACDDGDKCNFDVCKDGNTCFHGNKSCDDGNPCTSETCDTQKDCQYTNLSGQPCDDGKACTVGDVCSSGLGKSTCQPVAEVCTTAVSDGLLLHTHANVPTSVVLDGSGKVSGWTDVKVDNKGFSVPYVSRPAVAPKAVFGRPGLDLSSTGLQTGWVNPGAFTVAVAFRHGDPQNGANLLRTGNWGVVIVGGKPTVVHTGAGGQTTSASIGLSVGTSYILVLRITATEVRLSVYGDSAPVHAAGVAQGTSTGSQELMFGKLTAGQGPGSEDAHMTLGQVLLFNRALTDLEAAKLVAKMRSDFGLADCTQNAHCDDGNGCTSDICDEPPGAPRVCVYQPLSNPSKGICLDADPCSIEESCDNGVCKSSTFKVCDDSNPCTDDACNKATGKCEFKPREPSGSPCDDGNPCTVPDLCSGDTCMTAPRTCDDNNPCTTDSCSKAAGGCVFAANTASCDDGNVCTSNDACSNKVCAGTANTAPCNDGNPCTTNDTCQNGGCTNTKPKVCGNDDGDACTLEDCSVYVGCRVYAGKDCNDGVACTDDACDPMTGTCLHKPNAGQCSDGSVCTVGDGCVGGKCVPGDLLDCNDGSMCTIDACDAKTGCSHTATQSCDDGNACTEKDFCVFGTCLGGAPPNCDDGNVCTTDYCDVGLGCKHQTLADGAACEDGETCTVGDACAAGSCKSGPKVCDYAVTTTGDSGVGSLRQALASAEADQQGQWSIGKEPGLRTIGVFVSGLVKQKSALPLVSFAKVIDGRDQNLVIDGAGEFAQLDSYADLKVRNLKFTNAWRVNKQGDYVRGGAISVRRTPSLTSPRPKLVVEGCTLYGGTSDVQGGAIFAFGADVTIRDSVISLNARSAVPDETKGGGAVAIESDAGAGVAKVDIRDTRFEYNQGKGLGAALWCGPQTDCTVLRSSFYGNKGWKGVVAVDAKAKVTLVNVALESNEAQDVGGVIRSHGDLTLLHVSVTTTSVAKPGEQPVVYATGKTRFINSLLARNGQFEDAIDCAVSPQAELSTVIATTIGVAPPFVFGLPLLTIEGAKALRCSAPSSPPGDIGTPKLLSPLASDLTVKHYARIPKGAPDLDGADLPWCLQAGPDLRGAPRPIGNGCDRGAVEAIAQ